MCYSWFPKIFTVRCIATYSTNKHVGCLGAELIYLSDIIVHFDLETHYQRKSYGLAISIFNMFTKLRDCVFSMMSNISRVNNWHSKYKNDLIEGKITIKTSSDITFHYLYTNLHIYIKGHNECHQIVTIGCSIFFASTSDEQTTAIASIL